MPKLALYHYPCCGYCQKVQRALDELELEVEQVDLGRVEGARQELLDALGRATVPVLRIDEGGETRWMPESSIIVEYLYERAGRRDLLWRSRISSALMMAAVAVTALGLIGLGPQSIMLAAAAGIFVLSVLASRMRFPQRG